MNCKRIELKNSIGFFVAGHETSSHTLSFIILELSRNPQIQTELFEEIKNYSLRDEKSWETISQFKLLDNIVKETQRLHTVVGVIPRESSKDVEILGYDILAKSKVLINVRAIHRSSEYWEYPDSFLPARWDSPLKNSSAFLPFGQGAHNCIGQVVYLSKT